MTKNKYCEIHDSMYGRFGKWLEGTCDGPNCEYCKDKPKKHPRKCGCRKNFETIKMEMLRQIERN